MVTDIDLECCEFKVARLQNYVSSLLEELYGSDKVYHYVVSFDGTDYVLLHYEKFNDFNVLVKDLWNGNIDDLIDSLSGLGFVRPDFCRAVIL